MKIMFILLLSVSMSLQAQHNVEFLPTDLKIDWQLVTNHYNQSNQFKATIALTNTSKNIILPTAGWAIYYNGFKDAVNPDLGFAIQTSRIQGDLFCLKPTSGFKGIKPGETIMLDFIGHGWLYNISDAPTGFYWVWDNQPDKAYNITNVSVNPPDDIAKLNRNNNSVPESATPEMVFEANKLITPISDEQLPPVFPTPLSFQKKQGEYILSKSTIISSLPAFESEARYLADELTPFLGTRPKLGDASKNVIRLLLNDTLPAEGYYIRIAETQIEIMGSSPTGIFYGIQTLKCLLPLDAWKKAKPSLNLPCVEVYDAPRFGYRGLHLDVARNFQTKEQIMRMLNWMAMYKLNVMHFHLTEDEAWRLEIPELPELTSIGAVRGHTLDSKTNMPAAYGSGGDVKNPQSGYYTRADYIEILKFAKTRHIEVIPEIETPGHARAAIKAMNARYERLLAEGKPAEANAYLLADPDDKSVYNSAQNFNDNIMCVALPSVYTFIETVTDALIAMHNEAEMPLKTIQVGGDEVPVGTWEKSPKCNALLQLSQTDNYEQTSDLWVYYWAKVDSILKKRNLFVSGWEEIGMRETKLDGQRKMMVNPTFANSNFHAYVWNNVIGWGSEDLPYRMANGGYKVILCPVTNLYLDLAYQNQFYELGQYWGGFLDLDKPFSFIPFDYLKNVTTDLFNNPIDKAILYGKDRLTDYGKSNIVGIQGQLWSENMRSAEQLEYFAFPKMLALAERAWAFNPEWALEPDPQKSNELYNKAWSEFVNIIGQRELVKLCYYQGGANFRIPTVGASVINNAVEANIQLPGFVIRFTTDGTEPTVKSNEYMTPILSKGTIKLRAFDSRGRGGKTITIHNN